MNPFETYQLFNALRLHFTSTYDFFKFHGKIRCTIESFHRRKDKRFFVRLSKSFMDDELKEFIISVMLLDPEKWIGEVFNDEVNEFHVKRMGNLQSLSYIFRDDLMKLLGNVKSPNDLLLIKDTYPKLLHGYMYGDIQIETICILDNLLGFIQYWNDNIKDTIIWPLYYQKIVKYSPFLHYDVVKYKNTLKDIMSCG